MPALSTATVQIGTYNALTDTFTSVLDLNDGTNIWQLNGSPEINQPELVLQRASNPRSDGEKITNMVYKNRQINLTMNFGKAASYATIRGLITTFMALCQGTPFVLRYCPPSPNINVAYSYFDVFAVTHDADKFSSLRIINGTLRVKAILECAPYCRGDRQWLQNLAMNPGFEAPSGVGVTVFSDNFANVNAYVVQAGGAPTTGPSQTFVDNVFAVAAPNVYLRMDETSGTTAYDISGLGHNGTIAGSPTLGVAGLLTGDTDTCMTFAAASSQKVSVVTSLPGGNNAVALWCRFKYAAAPASFFGIMALGALVNKQGIQVYIDSAGKLNADIVSGGAITSAAAVTTATNHDALVTWDGTTLRLYLDGVSQGTPTTPGALNIAASPTFYVGASAGGSANFFTGQLDEALCFTSALTSGNASTLHTAANTGATGTVSNAMSLPAAARISFGSPAWRDINTWSVRFRWITGATYNFYLHRTDANNYLLASVASGGVFSIKHVVAGVTTTVATVTLTLVHEALYWLQVTQFPFPVGSSTPDPPYVTAKLFYDLAGAVGAQVTSGSISGACVNDSTAISGAPQIEAITSALVIGGVAGGNAVSLFGPGGWQTVGAAGTATGLSSGAWDQNSANTLSGAGAIVTSYGAARVDLAPAGTVDYEWRLYIAGANTQQAIPVRTAGDTLYVSAYSKSSGLGANATRKISVREYDASGTLLRTDANWHGTAAAAPTLTGNTAAWSNTPNLADFYVTGANCAYVDISLRTADTNAGASANGIAWFENLQVYNVSQTGVAAGSMPYCELRMPQGVVQMMVSGLLGDVAAPALLSLGITGIASAPGMAWTVALGRRSAASVAAQLIGHAQGFYGSAISPQSTAILNANYYGGYYIQLATLNATGWNPRFFNGLVSDLYGAYHFLEDFAASASTTNLANITARVGATQKTTKWYSLAASEFIAALYGIQSVALLSTSNQNTLCDVGPINFPLSPIGGLVDPSQYYYAVAQGQWGDNTGSGYGTGQTSFAALLPVDASIIMATLNNPGNSGVTFGAAQWLWMYLDPLNFGQNRPIAGPTQSPVGWTFSIESGWAVPAKGAGSAGTQTTGYLNVVPNGDPYLTVDPTVKIGATSVNQFAGVVCDATVSNLPAVSADLMYSPMYLYPRS